jgi:hypothetical protein
MIGTDLHITLSDGAEHTVPVTYSVACSWEDHHPGQAMEAMVREVKFKQIAYLAYEALRKGGITVKVWPQFIDTLQDVDFIPKARTKKDKQLD